jgi:hypothetical protein
MIKETLAFPLENSCSESSTLILETLKSSKLLDHVPYNVIQASDRSIQATKQTRTTKNRYTKQKESFKRAYKRIGLATTVTRA